VAILEQRHHKFHQYINWHARITTPALIFSFIRKPLNEYLVSKSTAIYNFMANLYSVLAMHYKNLHHALHGDSCSVLINGNISIRSEYLLTIFYERVPQRWNYTNFILLYRFHLLSDFKLNLRYFIISGNLLRGILLPNKVHPTTYSTNWGWTKLTTNNPSGNDKTKKLLQLMQRHLPVMITWNSVSFYNSTFLDVSRHRLVEKNGTVREDYSKWCERQHMQQDLVEFSLYFATTSSH